MQLADRSLRTLWGPKGAIKDWDEWGHLGRCYLGSYLPNVSEPGGVITLLGWDLHPKPQPGHVMELILLGIIIPPPPPGDTTK